MICRQWMLWCGSFLARNLWVPPAKLDVFLPCFYLSCCCERDFSWTPSLSVCLMVSWLHLLISMRNFVLGDLKLEGLQKRSLVVIFKLGCHQRYLVCLLEDVVLAVESLLVRRYVAGYRVATTTWIFCVSTVVAPTIGLNEDYGVFQITWIRLQASGGPIERRIIPRTLLFEKQSLEIYLWRVRLIGGWQPWKQTLLRKSHLVLFWKVIVPCHDLQNWLSSLRRLRQPHTVVIRIYGQDLASTVWSRWPTDRDHPQRSRCGRRTSGCKFRRQRSHVISV